MSMYSKKYKFSSISNEFWKIYFSDIIANFEEIKDFIALYKFIKEDLKDIPKEYNEEKKYKDIYTYIQDELDGKHTLDYIVDRYFGNEFNQKEIKEDKELKYKNCIEENKIEENYDFIFNYAMKKTKKRLEVKKSDAIGSGTWNEGHTPKFFLTLNKILKEDLKDHYSRFIEITKENFMKEEKNISSNFDKENFLVSFLERKEVEKLLLDSGKKEIFYLFIIIDKIILSDVLKEVIQKDFESFLNIQIEYIKMMLRDNREKHLFSFDEIDKNNATSLKVLIEFLVSLEENDFQKFESDFLEIISLDVEQYTFIYNKMIKEESKFSDMSWYFGSEYNISKDDQIKNNVAFEDRRYLNYLFDSNFLDKSMSDLKLYEFIRNKVVDGDRAEEYLEYLLKIDVDKVRKDENINIEKILEEAITHPKVFIAGFSSNSHIWELLENDEKYVELLEELKKSESEYISNSATSSLIRNYEKQKENKKIKFKELLENYSDSNKPLIITEGKTDWKHLKKALERFNANGEYKNLDIDFLEYEETDMGDSELATMVRTYSKGKYEKKHIMIFDRDATEKRDIKNIFNPKEHFTNHENKVYSLFIPPIGRLDKICIEFYYKQEEVQEAWFEGKRLFYGNEFDKESQKSICGKYKTDKPCPKDLDILDGDNKKKVYKIDDEEKKENNIALSKNKFSKNILKGIDGFDNFDIENFRLIFDEIEKIVKD